MGIIDNHGALCRFIDNFHTAVHLHMLQSMGHPLFRKSQAAAYPGSRHCIIYVKEPRDIHSQPALIIPLHLKVQSDKVMFPYVFNVCGPEIRTVLH